MENTWHLQKGSHKSSAVHLLYLLIPILVFFAILALALGRVH